MPPICQPKLQPRYRLHFEDLSKRVTAAFLKIPAAGTILQDATAAVLDVLYSSYGTPQAVRSVTMFLESMDGVAYTAGIPIDDLHKEIHVSLEYLSNMMNDQQRFHDECLGVITHEMVHCWQHNCCGTAPGGLIEGIADYVRLKAGLAPPHWKSPKEEPGNRWDEGYQKTAFFLDWLEDKYGKGTVSKINDHMDGVPYQEDKFWKELLGETVGNLWEAYLKHLNEPDDKSPPSVASTEPEIVDLTEEEKQAADAGLDSSPRLKAQEFKA